MTKTGMILGIIGGVIALLVGAVGYGMSSLGGSLSSSIEYQEGASLMAFYQLASLGLPVAALVGSGLVTRYPEVGAGVMGVSALGMVFVFGFGFFSMIPVVLLGVGAVLVVMEMNNTKPETDASKR